MKKKRIARENAEEYDEEKYLDEMKYILAMPPEQQGEALEALDFAGEQNSNFIVVLNDNDMSIAENHGGIYKNLKELRESNGKCASNIFKSFGLDYIYVDKGNDIPSLIEAFQKVKNFC